MPEKWEKISDVRVRHVWQCPECDKLTTVSPAFYEEAGTPFCTRIDRSTGMECGCDMVYVSTEINNG